MSRNIFGYTEPTSTNPGYISINESEDGATIDITVQTSGQPHMFGTVVIPESELLRMAERIYERHYLKNPIPPQQN